MRNLIFFAFILLFWSCEMQILEELAKEPETIQQLQGHYQVTSVSKSTIQSLGKRLEKKTGFNVIESAQMRQISDFTFDLEASQLTTDTLKRRTYTVPFLEKGDKYSTFNLVLVADSVDNVLEQYVLQYEFDSIQFQAFEQTKDLILSGAALKRYSFSSFFNDSNPGFLERCNGIYDNNGDPIPCETISNLANSTPSGGGGGGTAGSPTYTIDFGAGGSISCTASIVRETVVYCTAKDHPGSGCDKETTQWVIVWNCTNSAQKRLNNNIANIQCDSCDLSTFGSPAFTLTRNATQIDNLLTEFELTQWHMAYLSLNPAFSTEFKSLLQSESNMDQKVAMITLTAQMEGIIGSQMTPSFGLAIDDLVEADLSNPAILHLFNTYFSARAAFLKLSNPQKYLKNPNGNPKDPNNINLILYWDTYKEAIQWTLDIIGLVPFLGEPADLLNGVIYYIEGDGISATVSVASSLPFLGYITSGPKIGFKVIQSASDIQTKQVIRWILDKEGFITFGDQSQLRKLFPNILPTEQAHHIIPWSIQKHPIIQEAAKSKNAFHMNERLNGIPVASWRNQSHEIYNSLIFSRLEQIKKDFPGKDPDFYYQKVIELINKAKIAIEANPNLPLNQITFR